MTRPRESERPPWQQRTGTLPRATSTVPKPGTFAVWALMIRKSQEAGRTLIIFLRVVDAIGSLVCHTYVDSNLCLSMVNSMLDKCELTQTAGLLLDGSFSRA